MMTWCITALQSRGGRSEHVVIQTQYDLLQIVAYISYHYSAMHYGEDESINIAQLIGDEKITTGIPGGRDGS